jgi:hypothetical protein
MDELRKGDDLRLTPDYLMARRKWESPLWNLTPPGIQGNRRIRANSGRGNGNTGTNYL